MSTFPSNASFVVYNPAAGQQPGGHTVAGSAGTPPYQPTTQVWEFRFFKTEFVKNLVYCNITVGYCNSNNRITVAYCTCYTVPHRWATKNAVHSSTSDVGWRRWSTAACLQYTQFSRSIHFRLTVAAVTVQQAQPNSGGASVAQYQHHPHQHGAAGATPYVLQYAAIPGPAGAGPGQSSQAHMAYQAPPVYCSFCVHKYFASWLCMYTYIQYVLNATRMQYVLPSGAQQIDGSQPLFSTHIQSIFCVLNEHDVSNHFYSNFVSTTRWRRLPAPGAECARVRCSSAAPEQFIESRWEGVL